MELVTRTTLHACHLLLLLKVAHYLLYGRAVVALLDDDYFHQVYEDAAHSKLLCAFFLVFTSAHTLLLNPGVVVVDQDQNQGQEDQGQRPEYAAFGSGGSLAVDSILNTMAVFFSGSSLNMDYFILHYRQVGNRRALERIQAQLGGSMSTAREACRTVRYLATLNDHLNCRLAGPLLISCLVTLFSTVSCLCTALLVQGSFTLYLSANLVFISGGYFYLVYLTYFLPLLTTSFIKRKFRMQSMGIF